MASSFLAGVASAVLGDPSYEGLQAAVPTYEELHADVQAILIPNTLPRGVSVRLLRPLNKNFALTTRSVARRAAAF
jgi:hypothetical protein